MNKFVVLCLSDLFATADEFMPCSVSINARAAVYNEGKQSIVVQDKKSGTDRPWDFDAVWAGSEAQVC